MFTLETSIFYICIFTFKHELAADGVHNIQHEKKFKKKMKSFLSTFKDKNEKIELR